MTALTDYRQACREYDELAEAIELVGRVMDMDALWVRPKLHDLCEQLIEDLEHESRDSTFALEAAARTLRAS